MCVCASWPYLAPILALHNLWVIIILPLVLDCVWMPQRGTRYFHERTVHADDHETTVATVVSSISLYYGYMHPPGQHAGCTELSGEDNT